MRRVVTRGLLNFPRYNMTSYGRRAFSYAGPHVWNSLTLATNHFNRPFPALSKNVFIRADIALSVLETFLFNGLYKFTYLLTLLTFGCICLQSVCLYAITFESLDARSSFSIRRNGFRVSTSSSYIKVIGSNSTIQLPGCRDVRQLSTLDGFRTEQGLCRARHNTTDSSILVGRHLGDSHC